MKTKTLKFERHPNYKKEGVYETVYGNTCVFLEGEDAEDVDMGEMIPLSMIDWSKRIGEVEDYV